MGMALGLWFPRANSVYKRTMTWQSHWNWFTSIKNRFTNYSFSTVSYGSYGLESIRFSKNRIFIFSNEKDGE